MFGLLEGIDRAILLADKNDTALGFVTLEVRDTPPFPLFGRAASASSTRRASMNPPAVVASVVPSWPLLKPGCESTAQAMSS